MLTPVIRDGLERYGIGPRIRALRLAKGLGLVELGRHSGLSPALLSKIERAKIFPPLPTLLRISMVFGVGLEHFFSDDRRRLGAGIVRAGERKRLPERFGGGGPVYRFESLDFRSVERRFNSFLAWFEPAARSGKVREHHHVGAEFIHVLEGTLGLRVLGEEHVLQAGDAVYFDGSVSHGYRRIGRAPCRALVVTSP
jgi:transcriptional regulator with XRE-family HTH domain